MEFEGHRIKKVLPGGIAEEMGVEPGMSLVSVNGNEVRDVFDYRYFMDDAHVDVLIREEDGNETVLEIDKDPEEDFGVEFESSLMDDYKRCCNKCIFCFIDQMPKGMRDTLYFKDDDSRLSFLQGNYVTLTNMSDSDIDRIIRFHMEPINISVHTTNPALRVQMLGNRFAGDIFPKMKRLKEAGVTMNGQIVLCRGINDREELDRTIGDLAGYRPAMQSLSIVPVGLTRFRRGLEKLEPFTKKDAAYLIDQVEGWQKRLAEDAPDPAFPHFVHASDEWYILAGRPLPKEEAYDGYPQLENGVGMLTLMRSEVENELKTKRRVKTLPRTVTAVCGLLSAPYIRKYADLAEEKYPGLTVNVCPIRNDFFGKKITVTGLVTGRDLISQMKELQASGKDPGEELLVPVNMLRSGEKVFLDDVTTDDVARELGMPVGIVWEGGGEFIRSLLGMEHKKQGQRQTYEDAAK
ncbi:MAG TPA: DUF512 domain-containing protein [Lachnospiraceae bacterium]|nr:DUF512 domain-containing protein [Lachnospiraceae bacterium]